MSKIRFSKVVLALMLVSLFVLVACGGDKGDKGNKGKENDGEAIDRGTLNFGFS